MKDAKDIAEQCKAFVATPFGKHFIEYLSVQYNGLHHEAEDKGLSVEQKAMLVERAAGLKVGIDFFTERITLLDNKHFDKT